MGVFILGMWFGIAVKFFMGGEIKYSTVFVLGASAAWLVHRISEIVKRKARK